MGSIDPAVRYQLREGAISWTETDEGVAVLDLERSTYLAVNESGRVLWTSLAKGATLDELAEQLDVQFGVAPALARADARTFLTDVVELGLCVPSNAPSAQADGSRVG